MSRGIRQGCPISPKLFILTTQMLTLAIVNDLNLQGIKGDLTHTVSPNLMLILSTYRVVLHPSYLQKVFSFIIFIKERYRFTILSEKNRAPGGVPCGQS